MSIGHKRDREAGRVPVNMLKRVSQKAENYGVMYGADWGKPTKIIESSSSH